MFWLVQTAVPLGLLVVLPIIIVWIVYKSRINRDNKNTEIILKAVESNPNVDVDKLIASMQRQVKTPQQILQLRLLRGCIFSLIGIAIGGLVLAMALGGGCDYEDIYELLAIAAVSLAVGISYLIVYFVSRKQR